MAKKYEDRSAEELRELARERGIPSSGSKAELIERLRGGSESADKPASTAEEKDAEAPEESKQPVDAGRDDLVVKDWRASLLDKARAGDEDAKRTLQRILNSGSQEELKAFASLGFTEADAKLEPVKVPPSPGPDVSIETTQVTGETTGRQAAAPDNDGEEV